MTVPLLFHLLAQVQISPGTPRESVPQRSRRIGPRDAPGGQETRCQRGDCHHREGRPGRQWVAG